MAEDKAKLFYRGKELKGAHRLPYTRTPRCKGHGDAFLIPRGTDKKSQLLQNWPGGPNRRWCLPTKDFVRLWRQGRSFTGAATTHSSQNSNSKFKDPNHPTENEPWKHFRVVAEDDDPEPPPDEEDQEEEEEKAPQPRVRRGARRPPPITPPAVPEDQEEGDSPLPDDSPRSPQGDGLQNPGEVDLSFITHYEPKQQLPDFEPNEVKRVDSQLNGVVPIGSAVVAGIERPPRRQVMRKNETKGVFLSFDKWKKAKNLFITKLNQIGHDPKILLQMRRDVLGGAPLATDAELNIGTWWLLPKKTTLNAQQRAENKGKNIQDRPHLNSHQTYFKTLYGSVNTPLLCATLERNLLYNAHLWGPFFDHFVDCKRGEKPETAGWSACFIAMCHEFIRTKMDLGRSIEAIHKISIACTVQGSQRHKVWTELRKLILGVRGGAISKGSDGLYGASATNHLIREQRLLNDTNLTRAKQRLGIERSQLRQRNRLEINIGSIDKVIAEGRRKFVDNDVDEGKYTWADRAVWLALVCGSRKLELLFLSEYELVREEEKERHILPSSHDRDQWIVQYHIAKKGESAFKLPVNAISRFVVKPLLGNITAPEFLKVLWDMRFGVNGSINDMRGDGFFFKLLDKHPGKNIYEILRKTVSGFKQGALTKAFKRIWNTGVDEALFTEGGSLHFHTLRAMYGNASYYYFARKTMALTIWLGQNLGHDLRDNRTAMYYQTIHVTEPVSPTPKQAPEAMRELIRQAAIILKRVTTQERQMDKLKQELEGLAQRAGVETQSRNIFSERDQQPVSIQRLNRKGSKGAKDQEAKAIVADMERKGVLVVERNLRQLGFGSARINAIIREKRARGNDDDEEEEEEGQRPRQRRRQ